MYSPQIEALAAAFQDHDQAQRRAAGSGTAAVINYGLSARGPRDPKQRCGLFRQWYIADAVAAMSQAMGRAYRGPADRAIIIAIGVAQHRQSMQAHVHAAAGPTMQGPAGWQEVMRGAREHMRAWNWLHE